MKDTKSLRLTCKTLGEITPFSLSRVFLSANSLNIQVFRAIADHPKFRQEITEIIWDDASFVSAPLIWEDIYPITDPQSLETNPNEGCPNWFVDGCEENRYMMKRRKYHNVDRPKNQMDSQMPLKACWEYYSQILNDQTTVIESKEDEKAFLYGLERFPRLKRVTVTPATHGWLFSPLYETPMIRAFPYGFNYPIPRGWHIEQNEGQIANPLHWSEATDEYKQLWRGARIVLRVLSQMETHNVSELSFDSKQLPTGINYLIFERPCEEYNHFTTIMKRPGFRRLDISLFTGTSGIYSWAGFRSGYFLKAISMAKELTHIHLSTTFDDGSSMGDPPMPLKEVFPIEKWPKLYHLGLSRFSVNTSELIDLLNLAPASLRSIKLEFLEFPNDELRLSGLLGRMREELNWAERDQPLTPTVTIAMEGYYGMPGRFVEVTDEVANFLYGSGEIPVNGKDTRNPKFGIGTNRDLFEAEYTRPNVSV
ncbi:uncharacterized protein N7498_007126 [Penicillium cinerascens]|uniref:Uncharacterized protein n=1 Tax=Penicillium cinerascens TaxID=70096 RepID=A0A9W9MDP7_9EURO|nr:uncharacterized protein N7498_007126 [Penicillium cinerascens]KAJ5198009.1 hypothetical protein N7498_007126 [Penicillium cinerascens]